jgi:hypothetical protein
MKFWWVILFLSTLAFSQQEIELCGEDDKTFI